jgi:hypothetical protein
MNVSLRGSGLMGLRLLAVSALLGRSSLAADTPLVTAGQARAASITAATTAPPQPSTDSVEWSLSGAAGPVIVGIKAPSASVWPPSFGLTSSAWQLDLQRRRNDERFVAGLTLEGTYDHGGDGAGQQLLGTDVFVGSDWRHRHWTLEATIGAGLEAAQIRQQDIISYLPPQVSPFVYHSSYQLGFYAQGTLAAAVPVSNAVDVLLRLGVHLTGAHDEDWFGASTVGLRYRLP